MKPDSYMEWLSIYDDSFEPIWKNERMELRKITMIYSAFENELQKLKLTLNEEYHNVCRDFKKNVIAQKRNSFKGLAQSEKFDLGDFEKENESDEATTISNEDFLLKKKDDARNVPPSSPVLRKKRYIKHKRKSTTSPTVLENFTPKVSKEGLEIYSSPMRVNDSNILESSIIEETPLPNKRKKLKGIIKKKKNNPKLNKSKQVTTLTQMFFEDPKTDRHIDSNLPSMTVSEMIKYINESENSNETNADHDQSDETIDLDIPNISDPKTIQQTNQIQEKKEPPKVMFEEVVRGKEREKLKGWSCNECKNYYEALNLPPHEIQRKKNLCSRHRYKFKPREETFDGFWDLTFNSSGEKAPESQSMVLTYKK